MEIDRTTKEQRIAMRTIRAIKNFREGGDWKSRKHLLIDTIDLSIEEVFDATDWLATENERLKLGLRTIIYGPYAKDNVAYQHAIDVARHALKEGPDDA